MIILEISKMIPPTTTTMRRIIPTICSQEENLNPKRLEIPKRKSIINPLMERGKIMSSKN
jgi:hypothetical protein